MGFIAPLSGISHSNEIHVGRRDTGGQLISPRRPSRSLPACAARAVDDKTMPVRPSRVGNDRDYATGAGAALLVGGDKGLAREV